MRETALLLFSCVLCLMGQSARAQAVFVEKQDPFMDRLKERARQREEKGEKKDMEIKMDFARLDLPRSIKEFQSAWHHPPLSQDRTGSCWAFSSISFFESEVYRLTGRKIRLSETYTTYWEFVEKARRFVRERGDSAFGKGSQANATPRIWKQYGVVPAEAYGALSSTEEFYDDTKMFAEMKAYLESVKEQNAWNEEEVLGTIQCILNHYLGVPPEKVVVDGREMTPLECLEHVVALNLDDYVDVMSLMQEPYYQKVEYPVDDNWWHSQDYYNVPLDEFMKAIKKAVREGYTVCIVGDNSEPGFYPPLDVAMVPPFDIPPEYINEESRQLRFSNESTTDDHAIHLVGFLERDGKDWYLIKDSGSKARNGKHEGYMFYHEDFVKLKMMNMMVHRDVVENVLARFE